MDKQVSTFNKFLKDHKVNNGDITHISYRSPSGKYNIPTDDMNKFNEIYKSLLGKIDMYIMEMPKKVGPLIMDINFGITDRNREYDISDIKYFISVCNRVIRKYYKLKEINIKSFVLEKHEPTYTSSTSYYEDGFHVIYPHLPTDVGMRWLIREEVLKIIEEDNGFVNIRHINDIEKVINKFIIEGVLTMYGSMKYKGVYYNLTHIYTNNLEDIDLKQYNKNTLQLILSNRKFNNSNKMEYKDRIDIDKLNNRINIILAENNSKYIKRNTGLRSLEESEVSIDESNSLDNYYEEETKETNKLLVELGVPVNKWDIFSEEIIDVMLDKKTLEMNKKLYELGIPTDKWNIFSDEIINIIYNKSNKDNKERRENHFKKWTEEQEIEMINSLKEGNNYNTIGINMGRTTGSIKMRMNGILSKNNENDSDEIIEKYGIIDSRDQNSIRRYLKKLNS